MRVVTGTWTVCSVVVGVVGVVGCSGEAGRVGTQITALTSAPDKQIPERSFTAFEAGQVRPLALSADGRFLYAANTPDNRVEILIARQGRSCTLSRCCGPRGP